MLVSVFAEWTLKVADPFSYHVILCIVTTTILALPLAGTNGAAELGSKLHQVQGHADR
jgi:hypothetical protein